MQADVSPNGVITEVRVRNKFTTAKTEFQHLSSERTADSAEEEEKSPDTGECPTNTNSESYLAGSSEDSDGVKPSENCVKTEVEEKSGDIPEHNHSNGTEHHSDDAELTNEKTTNSMESNSEDSQVSNNIPGGDASNTEILSQEAACLKKPKLESQDVCDNNGGFDPLGKNVLSYSSISVVYLIGDKNVLHSIMSQIEEFVRPFPSPDHTYAISPVKDEDDIKSEPPEEECETPTYRKKVVIVNIVSCFLCFTHFLCQLRQRKSPKYTENDEDYFLMCQENLLNSLKRKHMKKRESYKDESEEDSEEESKEMKEIEYRTIKWAKDALYFRYDHDHDQFLTFQLKKNHISATSQIFYSMTTKMTR